MKSRDIYASCLETLSLEREFSCAGLWSVSTLVIGSVSSFHVSSCLISHDCVLTVSLSGIAKCLFCVETLTFLADSRPLGPFIHCLLAYCKTVVLVVVVIS